MVNDVNGWGLEIFVQTIFELSFLKSWFEELEENGKTCQDTVVFSLQWGEWIRGWYCGKMRVGTHRKWRIWMSNYQVKINQRSTQEWKQRLISKRKEAYRRGVRNKTFFFEIRADNHKYVYIYLYDLVWSCMILYVQYTYGTWSCQHMGCHLRTKSIVVKLKQGIELMAEPTNQSAYGWNLFGILTTIVEMNIHVLCWYFVGTLTAPS